MRDELTYKSLRTRLKEPLSLRIALVQHALEHGVKPAARAFGTTPQTVRLWLGRYRRDGVAGLKERSHRLQKAHLQRTPAAVEARVVALHLTKLSLNRIAALLREEGVPISSKTVGKILRRQQLLGGSSAPAPRREPAPRRPFDEVQLDVTDLYRACDCRPQIDAGALPRYGFSLRDSATGAGFIAYARVLGAANVRCFVERTLRHLRAFGLRPRVLHTLEGSVCAEHKLDRALVDVLLEHAVVPNLLPVAEAELLRSVASFDRLLEREFYHRTTFADEGELLARAWAFARWFNLERRDQKRQRSPLELARRQLPGVTPQALVLEPIRLDSCVC